MPFLKGPGGNNFCHKRSPLRHSIAYGGYLGACGVKAASNSSDPCRHCERSEAIQWFMDCRGRYAPSQ
jgi:hypothetical protein